MASIDQARQVLRLKLVLAGAPFSGKEEILRDFANKIGPARYQSTQIGESSVLSAYLTTALPGYKDWSLELSVHTVTGQMDYNATMELLLENSDGLVFVCPLQQHDTEQIRESLQAVIFNLKRRGFDLASYPFVLHYREQDQALAGINLDEVEVYLGITPSSLRRYVTPYGRRDHLSDALIAALSMAFEQQKESLVKVS